MISTAPKAVAAYYAAEQAHDQNRLDEDSYIAALHKLDDWKPATASDFVHKFIALHHDGYSPNHERLQKLIEQARSAIAPPDAESWTAANKAEQEAREAADHFHDQNVKPIYAAHDAGTATLDDTSTQEEAYGQYTSAHYDTVTALMVTPAPNWQAVTEKLRMGCEDGWYFDGSDECHKALQAIRVDVERLSGEA